MTTTTKPFGFAGYIGPATPKTGTKPATFGLAAYTTATTTAKADRIPTIWSKAAH